MADLERTFVLSGRLTSEEFASAQRLHVGRVYGCLMPTIVVVFALVMNSLGVYLDSWEAWPVFLVGIGFPLAYVIARRYSLARLFRQHPMLALPQEGELTEQGLRMRSELGNAQIPWRFLVRTKANAQVLLLYESPQSFIVLPRSFFEEDAQFRAAVECARSWSRSAKNVST